VTGQRSGGLFLVFLLLAATPAAAGDVEEGAALYEQMCKHCHGPNMVNPGTVSFDLSKFPRDQAERFYRSVTKGKDKMPPLGDLLKPFEIDQLWAYVSSRGGKLPPVKKKSRRTATRQPE
jgi:mono/diheme cytochrome c family protein